MNFERRSVLKERKPEVCSIHKCGDCLCMLSSKSTATNERGAYTETQIQDIRVKIEKIQLELNELIQRLQK